MTFDEAFQKLVGHEGGFQSLHNDRGNWTSGVVGQGVLVGTKFGISAMTYPAEDIKGMTLARAKELYRRDFWGPAGCDAVPEGIKFDLFDMAVNSGVKAAIKTLQQSVGAVSDGSLGPLTLQAINSTPAVRLAARFNGHRLDFMAGLSTWPAFSRGWARRIAANLVAL